MNQESISQSNILCTLESLGEMYIRDFLNDPDNKDLTDDWYKAFMFFISHLYMQGRRDEVSEKFLAEMKKCLAKGLGDSPAAALESLWNEGALPHEQITKEFNLKDSSLGRLFTREMGKGRDLEMVLDALRYVHGVPEYNIVKYSLSKINQGKISDHRADLQKIRQVGPKVSAFYLRDLTFLFHIELDLKDCISLQPIDTWVRKVRKLTDPSSANSKIKDDEWFVEQKKKGHDPALLNAGAWYLGKHSFDFCLEVLSKKKMSREEVFSLKLLKE